MYDLSVQVTTDTARLAATRVAGSSTVVCLLKLSLVTVHKFQRDDVINLLNESLLVHRLESSDNLGLVELGLCVKKMESVGNRVGGVGHRESRESSTSNYSQDSK